MDNDERPIMVVFDSEGFVYLAGQPRNPTAKEWREWSQPGWKVINMSFKEYKAANYKWIYDKK